MRFVLGAWPLIEADLHEHYGIDLDTITDLEGRSWRSLRNRIHGLTTNPRTRAHAWLRDEQEAKVTGRES